jgi:DNA-binding LacI/PurR family transcriptional regulator
VLFVGEFGVPAGPDPEADRRALAAFLDALERRQVPLAALWVYDFKGQDGEWNATFTNARRDQLEAVAAANRGPAR